MGRWTADMLAGAIGGLASGLLFAAILALNASWVSDFTAEVNPTCESPRGLVPVPARELIAEGSSFDAETRYSADRAIDGYGGSIWVPPLNPPQVGDSSPVPIFATEHSRNVLTLSLQSARDIRLICVDNGLANTFTNYENWGRVRTVKIWTDDASTSQTVVLQSLGQDDFPNAQIAARKLGSTDTVHIAVVNAYGGQTVESYDPDVCLPGHGEDKRFHPPGMDVRIQKRYDPGCIKRPEQKAGLSDIFIYAKG